MSTRIAEILLVEDSPYDAELTMAALKSQNLANALFHVEDGVAALDFVFARGEFAARAGLPMPSLILLDLKMPRMGGMEVLERLKSDMNTRTIPIVVLTSSNEDPDILHCYELGVNSYIVKPVDFNAFAKAVKDIGLYWLVMNTPPK